LHSARVIAERVRRGVDENTQNSEERATPVTVSLGVAELGDKEDFDMLLNRADAALYRAKLAGRNTVSD
ncbi:MAG: diguanylate cyclase, partial [Pseudomonadota bacterium]